MTKFIKVTRAYRVYKSTGGVRSMEDVEQHLKNTEMGIKNKEWSGVDVYLSKETSEIYLNADYIASFQKRHLSANYIESFKRTLGENSEPELFESVIYLSKQYTELTDETGSSFEPGGRLFVKESVEEILSQLKK